VADNITRLPNVVVRKTAYTVTKASALMGKWGVCFAIYGPPGSGKSTLAAQAAHSTWAGKVGVIDVEGGARAYGDHDDIDVFSVKDSDERHDNGMGFAMVEDILDDLVNKRLVPAEGGQYGTIVLDNLSELNAYCTYDTIRTVGRNIDRKDRPDQKDWNTTTSRMLLIVRRFRDFAQASGTNVIFIAWDRQQEDRVTGIAKKDIALNPALASQLPGLLDMVGYLTIGGKGKRTLSFEASASTAAKFRRSPTEIAMSIPSEFEYAFNSPLRPMTDLINCLKGNVPFPNTYAKVGVNNRQAQAKTDAPVLSGADLVNSLIRGSGQEAAT
jgi:phage nucleotide-binding protein